jgi:hypothetical protein
MGSEAIATALVIEDANCEEYVLVPTNPAMAGVAAEEVALVEVAINAP